jgi:hypothetical protein
MTLQGNCVWTSCRHGLRSGMTGRAQELMNGKTFEETALACSFLTLLALSLCGNIPSGSLSFYPLNEM